MAPNELVLLVTAIPDHADCYASALREHGFRVTHLWRGDDALAVTIEAAPDLAMIDVRLPDMSGWDLCRSIKACADDVRPPVVVLTDDVWDTCAEQSARAGCNAWLARPSRADDIVRVARQVLSSDVEEPPSPAAAILDAVRACPACATDRIRATLRMRFIQYYCCQHCGLCWRVDTTSS